MRLAAALSCADRFAAGYEQYSEKYRGGLPILHRVTSVFGLWLRCGESDGGRYAGLSAAEGLLVTAATKHGRNNMERKATTTVQSCIAVPQFLVVRVQAA